MTSCAGHADNPPDSAPDAPEDQPGNLPDIRPDDKDWTWVLQRPCPECGFDAGAVAGR